MQIIRFDELTVKHFIILSGNHGHDWNYNAQTNIPYY